MNSIWKRSLAMLLSLVMVFGMLPMSAFAEDGVEGQADDTVYVAYIGEVGYETLQGAINAAQPTDTITVMSDVTEEITYVRGNLVSGKDGGVTVTSTSDGWVSFGDNFAIGTDVTFNADHVFVYCSDGVVNGSLVVGQQYYQRYADSKLTINAPGNMVINGEGAAIIRYMDGDAESGLYINGDDDDSTVELKLGYFSFYQGTISAEDAVIEVGAVWQNNTEDGNEGKAIVKLDNSTMKLSTGELPYDAQGNAEIILTNGSEINVTGADKFSVADTVVVSVDESSAIYENGEKIYPAASEPEGPTISGTLSSSLINMDDAAETFISAEITGLNATESVVIKLYSQGTQIATTTLKKAEYFTTSPLGVKIIITGDSSSWETVWAEGMPCADAIPDTMTLFVDGQEMNSANVPMTKTGTETAVNWAEVPGVKTIVETPELPTATATKVENENLTFAMNFVADEVTDEQLAFYGDWYADFELTVNKDMTVNANGGANGYLSGQYDEWSPNWVSVPFENVDLKAGEALKIMAYASDLMGEPGLKYTYGEVYEVVKDFDCGMFIEPAFLEANPDLKITLELRMYNPADESESYVIGETYTFEVPATPTVPELPTATATKVENENLTFAMNFVADEVTDEQLAFYGDWYADFELTVNKDMTVNANGGANGYLSGQYDEWSPNWVNVPFENVELKAEEPLKIMAYASELMGEPGLKYTYGEVYEVVKDFDCGMFIEPAFLEANPDLEITLELRMYNPADESESYVIGETYTFEVPATPTVPELPTATATKVENENLTFAMNFVADEVTDEQLEYYGDWYADFELTVNKDMTVNANGGANGYLSGQYDEWSPNWVNVPFENVELKAEEPLKIMAYASELMGEPGLKYTYGEVYEVVKDFDCGMFIEPAFLEANPDLEITLELRMYNPADESESYVIGETYTFEVPATPTVPELPTATATDITQDGLTFAMNFKADEVTDEQLEYYGDWYADFELTVNKDMTVNANGGADGYLSGQYDSWSPNWVNVPFEKVELKAGEALKIMEYASELMGEPGLKYTYFEVYDRVKDFDCGMFFEPEFLAANPDLKVTLELRMYNNEDETESYTIGDTYVFTVPTIPALPTATATKTENENLTFAMNFKADEVTEEQLEYYGDWYADFELTVNKDMTVNANGGADGYLSGQYDSWSPNWVSVPFEAVELKANESLKIMEYASELMGEPGLKYTYFEVYDRVKDFDCGMFFEPAFLLANPDLEVTLELRMYNPHNENINYTIGETYVFTLEDYVAYNVQQQVFYTKASSAALAAAAGETVILLKNAADEMVFVKQGTTFDLNGYKLTTGYMTSYGTIVDSSEDNTGRLSAELFMLQNNNAQLPVNTAEGYAFVEVIGFNQRMMATNKYVFQPLFEEDAHALLLEGQAVTGVTINVDVSWKENEGVRTQSFVYNDELLTGFIESYKEATKKYSMMFTLTLTNTDGIEDLSFNAKVVSDKAVVFAAPDIEEEGKDDSNTGDETGNVKTDTENKVTEAVNLTNENATAEVPSGTQLEAGTTNLTLNVSEVEKSATNITLGANEVQKSVDVHIDGVSADNTVPMIITLNEFAPKNLNQGNLALYHVENGETVIMTRVFSLAEVDAHNEFYYDLATGDVTMALATFSEVAVVADTENAWKGEFDYSWYAADAEVLKIANADQLAGFGAIVGGMAEGIEEDSFAGQTVKLIADINIGDTDSDNNIVFYPIGYNNSTGSYKKESGGSVSSGFNKFEGTFDGQGHTVANFYQNTWEMFGDYNDGYSGTPNHYRDGMGLFGKVYGGTVQNLTVKNFSSDGEFTTTGCIAAYADFGATFKNISVFNCNPRVYNIGNGGIVGCVGWYTKGEADKKVSFTNITVDNSNKISALWGSWDVACGGIVGQYYPTSGQGDGFANAGVHFENCHASAQIDVYNDVCANYQYYAYRYSGMMIGSIRENETIGEHVYPKMAGISANNCTVDYGNWNDYYYCELVDNSLASYTHDHQMSRLTEIKAINGTTITYLDGTTGTVPASGRANYVIVDYTKGHGTENAECYHFLNGETWTHEQGGYETTDVDKDGNIDSDLLKEDKQHIYREFKQLFTGYGWGVTSVGLEAYEGITVSGITEDNPEKSVVKFKEAAAEEVSYTSGATINIGDLFEAIQDCGVEIDVDNVQVTVSPVVTDGVAVSNVSGTYTPDTSDWTKGTLTFSGSGEATITITDYYFCTPTTIKVTVESSERFEIVLPNTETYLYRIGNMNTVALGSLFKVKEAEKDKIDVETVNAVVEGAEFDFTQNTTDWTKSTIQIKDGYTGLIKVSLKDDKGSVSPVLNLEVVTAMNTTGSMDATDYDVVLLQDCALNDFEVSGGHSFYGNGFTMTDTTDSYALSRDYSWVMLDNGTLDNVQIVAPNMNYPVLYDGNKKDDRNNKVTDANGTTRYYNVRSAVNAKGNSSILNSMVSGGRAAIYAMGGTITIDNTTVIGGAAANIHVNNSVNKLTLRDVTLVQEPILSSDGKATLMGLSVGVMAGEDKSVAPIYLEGTLKQYAWANEEEHTQYVPEDYQTFVTNALNKDEFTVTVNGKESINLGFICMPEGMGIPGQLDITDNRTDKDQIPYGHGVLNSAPFYSIMEVGYDNSVSGEPDDYKPTEQDSVMPEIVYTDIQNEVVVLTTEFKDSNWLSTLTVDLDMISGNTYDFAFNKVQVKKYGTELTFTVKDASGNTVDKDTVITLNALVDNSYTLVVTDNLIYNENGELTEEVLDREMAFRLVTIKTSIPDPTITYTSTTFTNTTNGRLRLSESKNGDWRPTANALAGVTITYWDGSETVTKDLGTLDLSDSNSYKISDNVWTYTGDNYTLKLTGGEIKTGYTITPIVTKAVDSTNKLFYCSTKVAYGTTSANDNRSFKITYELTNNNKTATWNRNETVNFTGLTVYDYSDFKDGSLNEATSCVTPDTLITLADGTQKRIDAVTYEDQLLVWDFYKGEYAVVPSAIIFDHGYDNNTIIKLNFSDGTDVKVVNLHQFFDADLNAFVSIDAESVSQYVGHKFAKQDGTTVELASYTVTEEYERAMGIISAEHYNIFVENMLSTDFMKEDFDLFNYFEVGDGMKFDQDKMNADIAQYGLYTYEEFADYLTYEQFMAFNVPYMKVAVGKGTYTFEGILNLIDVYLNAEA